MTLALIMYGVFCLVTARLGFRYAWEHNAEYGYADAIALFQSAAGAIVGFLGMPVILLIFIIKKLPKPSAQKLGNAIAGKSKARKIAEAKKP